MKKLFFTLLSVLMIGNAMAQDKLQDEVKPVITEGKAIYELEMANRVGNNLFKSSYKGKEVVAGFVSYPSNENIVTVFYSAGEKPKALGSIVFDKSFEADASKMELGTRDLTPAESELMKLNIKASNLTQDAEAFTLPSGAKFDLVPMISANTRKVFVLTESTKEGIVIFGNDYLLTFDSKLNVTDKKSLHKNMAAVEYDKDAGTANDKGSTHTHLAQEGEMVTATDIATLFLYEKSTKWSQHTFISENYIFFWNYGTHDLQVITKAAPKTK
jgi:hypothetical protein